MNTPKYRVQIFPRAELDLKETKAYFSDVLKTASTKVFESFLEVIDKLEENPMIYPLVQDAHLHEKGYRFIPLESFLLFFVIKGRSVEIRRFLYGGRKYSGLL